MGCSDQSVPSLSNVAIRSATGMNCGPPSVVTAVTKSMIAVFEAPAFQEGNGSAGATAGAAAGAPGVVGCWVQAVARAVSSPTAAICRILIISTLQDSTRS